MPKITGFSYSEILGKIHFFVFFFGVNITFFPMHFLLRHRSLWFYILYIVLLMYIYMGSLLYYPSDTGCIVGQRTRDVEPTRFIITQVILLSELAEEIWLT